MYFAQGEFEGVLNSIGQRQYDLMKQLSLSMAWFAFNKEEGSKARRPPVQFPEFSPSSVGYRFELVNKNPPPKYDRKRKWHALFSFTYSTFVIEFHVQENINEKLVAKICVHFSFAFFLCLFSFSLINLQ